MCGLVAMLRIAGVADLGVVERMTQSIVHRGPDDGGSFAQGPVALGFRRLSILDLSPAGHQPMTDMASQVTIVFNGEIYNFVEIRRELASLGHTFHSSGDTEVLLRAYLQWGQDCVKRLNGMWAFVIHDPRRKVLFGARDRFGIKPLYRHRSADCVLFASEIKAIVASGLYRPRTNWRVAADYLMTSSLDQTTDSFFENVEQVAAGSAFELRFDGGYREWRYWELDGSAARNSADVVEEYASLFEDAMKLHMRSDVPVAVHLSGGLDSTAIACVSARLRTELGARDPLVAFCYTPEEFDESAYVDATLGQTGACAIRLETDARKLWDDLPQMLWYQDEPVHSLTAVVGYQLMRLTAGTGLKVVLNGQGADETAAGYPSYFTNYWQSLLRRGSFCRAWSELAAHSRAHGRSVSTIAARQLRFFVRSIFARLPAYRRASRERTVEAMRSNPWFDSGLAGKATPITESLPDYLLGLSDMLSRSVRVEPLPLYLRVEDRNSSASSVEARVPFLDYRLVEFLFNLSDGWRLRGPWNKFIQRESMRGRIPENVRTRLDKMGFPVPVMQLFAGPLYEPLRDLLNSRATRERGIVRVDRIIADLERHRRGEAAISSAVFRVAAFELWARQRDQESASTATSLPGARQRPIVAVASSA